MGMPVKVVESAVAPATTVARQEVRVDPANATLVQMFLEEAHKRGDRDLQFINGLEAGVNALINIAIEHRQYTWRNQDKYYRGKNLLTAVAGGAPLNQEQTDLLVKALQRAGVKTLPVTK